MAKIYVAKRVIDYQGLLARGIPEGTLAIDETMAPVLALIQGMGSDGAKLLSVDANGNLLTAPGTPQVSNIGVEIFDQSPGRAWNSIGNLPDAGQGLLSGSTGALIYNGVTFDRQRSAGSLAIGGANSLGAALTALPGNWSVFSSPAIGGAAVATRAAGGAGVRHVCTGLEIVISSQVAIAAGQLLINLRDGATGAGTILRQWVFNFAAVIVSPISLALSSKSIFGSTATAMTLESTAGYANLGVNVNFDGYDAA